MQVPMTGCKQCLEWQARRRAAGWTDGRTPGCGSLGQQVRPPLCRGQRGLALLAARAPPHPVSPTPLCPESPQGRHGERPAGGTVGPLLPLSSTITHPPPQRGALHSVQKPVTYLQPAADGPAQGPPAPTGASQPCPGPRAAGGTGRRAPEQS